MSCMFLVNFYLFFFLFQLLPGIQIQEFRNRRYQLMEDIWQHNPSEKCHIVVIPSKTPCFMTERIPYPYRQDTDMLYLSGCTEPGSALVITSKTLGRITETLFVRGRDPRQELWDGPRIAANQTCAMLFGVDEILASSELVRYLQSFADHNNNCILWYVHFHMLYTHTNCYVHHPYLKKKVYIVLE